MATTHQGRATTSTTPSDRDVVITRVVGAARKLVFDAWSAFPLMVALGIYAARLAARRDEASLDRILGLVEEIIEGGRRGAVEVHFLEVFAGGLNELPVDRAHVEALFGPKTRESVGWLRAMGFWEAVVLPRALSDLLR